MEKEYVLAIFQNEHPPKIAYLALCLAILAFFTPGIYFLAIDPHLPQRTVALKGFLIGMIISSIGLTLSIVAIINYRKKDKMKDAKFARSVVIISSVILIFQIGVFTIFLIT